jgi:hypothetical protein
MLAYFSPDTLLPATSVIATIAGVMMILGRTSFRFLIYCFRRSIRFSSRVAPINEPHFRLRDEDVCRVVRR